MTGTADNARKAKKLRKHTVQSEMARALHKYSFGRLTVQKARETAAKFAPVFEEEAKKNTVLAHKGVNWFAKEVLKVV